MVRAIRNVKTGEYFNKGKWTPNYEEAQKFDGVAMVVKVCAALQLKDVEMVMWMEPDHRELRIPIPDA